MRKPKFKDDIIKLKQEGSTYREIADELGISLNTVQYWLNPEFRNKSKKRSKKYSAKSSDKYIEKYNESHEFRCKNALRSSIAHAKKGNFLPCNATIKELLDAFNGYCYICNIEESKCSKRLHMDHCHKTGKFRGWLCGNCNRLLGKIENQFQNFLKYLNVLP